MSRKYKLGVFDLFTYGLLAVFCFSILLPFWDMLLLSVSDPKKTASLTLRLWPQTLSFDAYEFAFSNNRIPMAYLVTFYRAICGTALTVFLVTIAAYPLSKRDLPFRNYWTSFFLIPMFFGGGMIPTYLIIRKLGLIDNLLVYILPGAVGVFYVLLVRNFLMSMEKEIEDAAFIDGAGYIRILFYITMPLSKPILATIALLSIVGHWNAWFDALIYIRSDNNLTLQAILQQLLSQASSTIPTDTLNFNTMHPDKYVTGKSFQAALTMITIGPIVLVYPFFQKYFVKGIMIGSLKG
ncbi:carbohydrate ABC transporter permease [Paenibacillus eucommiae]|uniref:Aldouronate transport system permease protein n=1 Tax=Paenibacillus eucommiae TaxID=1355755 RepID=A0ABS4IS53_9BACL|nr:carbohydrate ABC transporter permease [Paenibacillus eucommiae]MBP1990405.1 putative aldouronate transport system permease protein [Paenibacillus eucommiae]